MELNRNFRNRATTLQPTDSCHIYISYIIKEGRIKVTSSANGEPHAEHWKMVPMSHYLPKWTQNRLKWLLFQTEKLRLEEEAAGRKDKGSDFLDGAYRAQETKAKCEKWDCRWHSSTNILYKNENHRQSQKRRWQTSCQLFVCIQRISQSLTAENIVSMSSIGCTFAVPSLDGGVQDVCSWWGKRRRRWTQSEGESGWLPVPLIEKKLHVLYCRVAHTIKWRQRAYKLGCGLRSRI